ncbi:hypothetical protein Poly59_14050 [Rubripirellula reticaptiva]|uniref:Uncharacterized protein n=1 Tax=Rubripirellula reticaptiva TaxID=2528013 RepID=A0A5C6F5I2_9BACT|nr:hypothetical protein Poly59_14050 [Rubripirellula reticaptiva]
MHRLVASSSKTNERKSPDQRLGHRVIIAEGAPVAMADTPENQTGFRQLISQTPRCRFPILRVVAIFASSTDAILGDGDGTLPDRTQS